MKYYEANFVITPCSQDARDILAAVVAEAGFETFEETEEGVKAYVQKELFNPETLEEVIQYFPMDNTPISYSLANAEDRDWNEQWENEGFSPIVIDNRLIIHDGRHLPSPTTDGQQMAIEIDAKLAFGTGTHETTRMICKTLLNLQLKGTRVLDCGCGTGILGICAVLLGASSCVAYDIDEWSVDNVRHNAVINHVGHLIKAIHGDASILDSVTETFDIVMANINRNILLQDMPRFQQKMHTGSLLILSGFYHDDCRLLLDKARQMDMVLQSEDNDGDWHMLVLKKV
jgi:ribosomal protein L11 methyltransferase